MEGVSDVAAVAVVVAVAGLGYPLGRTLGYYQRKGEIEEAGYIERRGDMCSLI